MKAVARLLILSFIAGFTFTAAATSSCDGQAKALLQKVDPISYQQLFGRNLPDAASTFGEYLDCSISDYMMPSSAHETLHIVAAYQDRYPLLNGSSVPKLHLDGFHPNELVAWLPATSNPNLNDENTGRYLKGELGQEDLDLLIDELNAYSRNTHLDVELRKLGQSADDDTWARGALVSMMFFVKLAVEKIKVDHPEEWARLKQDPARDTVASVWREAEAVHAEACPLVEIGFEDNEIARDLNDPSRSDALTEILGRKPRVSANCASDDDSQDYAAALNPINNDDVSDVQQPRPSQQLQPSDQPPLPTLDGPNFDLAPPDSN